MTSLDPVFAVAERFVSAYPLRLEPLGQGLINDTYLVTAADACFVLQRINGAVFPEPAKILANLRALADHVERRGGAASPLRLPALLPARDGGDCHIDDRGGFWRALEYIGGTRSFPQLTDASEAAEVGRVLGQFHRLAADLPVDGLHDTLPGFHIAPGYLARFDAVCERGGLGAHSELREALDFVSARRALASVLEDAKDAGRLPLRVIHGDPKADNVLFDESSGLAVSLIDLDTVKPGLVHYDIGDCIRSCCNRAGENGQGAAFDLAFCRAVLMAYWEAARSFLTDAERGHFYDAIRLLPFELGLRFLTDHLEGDVYFKVDRPGHNLQRARVQFQLVESIEAQELAIRALIAELN